MKRIIVCFVVLALLPATVLAGPPKAVISTHPLTLLLSFFTCPNVVYEWRTSGAYAIEVGAAFSPGFRTGENVVFEVSRGAWMEAGMRRYFAGNPPFGGWWGVIAGLAVSEPRHREKEWDVIVSSMLGYRWRMWHSEKLVFELATGIGYSLAQKGLLDTAFYPNVSLTMGWAIF